MVLAATHVRALDYVTLDELKQHAVDAPGCSDKAAADDPSASGPGQCSGAGD